MPNMWAGPQAASMDGAYDVDDYCHRPRPHRRPRDHLSTAPGPRTLALMKCYVDFMGDQGRRPFPVHTTARSRIYSTENNGAYDGVSFRNFKPVSRCSKRKSMAFLTCIDTGEKLPSHIDTVLITAKMMQAIYDSAEQHREIVLE